MAEKSSWLKDNLVLVAGITLPVIIVVLFGAASIVPTYTNEPPRYSVVYTDDYYSGYDSSSQRVKITVEEGKVKVTTRPKTDENKYHSMPKIYVYNPTEKIATEIKYDLADAEENGEVKVKELENLTLDTTNKAPDGYVFENYTNSGYNDAIFFGGLFGGGYRNGCSLSKDGYRVRIKSQDRYNNYCYNHKFLGWVVSK